MRVPVLAILALLFFTACRCACDTQSSSERQSLSKELGRNQCEALTAESVLGSGSFGTVYKGWNGQDDIAVALKETFATEQARAEARVLLSMRNVNGVAKLYGWCNADNMGESWKARVPVVDKLPKYQQHSTNGTQSIVLVFELLDGGKWIPLSNLIPRWHAVESRTLLSDALCVAYQVTHVIAEAHSRGIVHRDVKSANIMVAWNEAYMDQCIDSPALLKNKIGLGNYKQDTNLANAVHLRNTKSSSCGACRWNVKVIDWALASDGSPIAQAGIVGTLQYMAPETARAIKIQTSAVDVWALGIVLWEILHNRVPFPVNPIGRLKKLQGPIPCRKGIPVQVKAFFNTLLAIEAKQRPTAQECCLAIGTLLKLLAVTEEQQASQKYN